MGGGEGGGGEPRIKLIVAVECNMQMPNVDNSENWG